jgi:DNA polymerase-3 subunit delta'
MADNALFHNTLRPLIDSHLTLPRYIAPMSLRDLYGHEAARARLLSAARSDRLPQALLFEGPQGVGKQRLALWLAQALLCERQGESGGCGSCSACRMVTRLTHPDVHWFVPLEPPKRAADADKQVELVETALSEVMADRRERPLYEAPSGMAVHSIATVRLLLRQAALTPVVASHKVFIIGDAERLIPQRASPDAANALLKLLEEPPADTILVLTAADPEALLPTIVSRVVRVRLRPLPDSVVTSFVQNELNGEKGPVSEAEGRIGRLLARIGSGSTRDRDPSAAFRAALRGSDADRYRMALRQAPFQARGGFSDLLDDLLERLQAEARKGTDPGRVAQAISLVLEARDQASGNVNPQLLMAVLADDLAGPAWP